ncbi:unnamed protein product [Ambrosiozyma monospora]|uniref:Unnamed protein product n=1 Tax=Ambrosiozyma monospora TaxID=43982 RepID=A0ACB5TA73_AMBMO|nr:unnamed protein product [Ambrosiozyma monospora]
MFVLLCVTIINDLGLTGRPYYTFSKEEGAVMRNPFSDEVRSLEMKSIILVVYFMAVSISLLLRRRIPVQWNDYLNQSCVALEASNERQYYLVSLYARVNHMLERIHYTMHAQNELVSMLELSGTRYKHIMNAYQRQLDMLKQQIKQKTNENKSDYNCLMAYLFSVQAYLYEPAIHSIVVSTSESVPFLEETNNFNFFIHVISQASESCMLSLKHFLELDLDTMATSPLFHSSRILYNTGLLLRLRYLTLTQPHLEGAIYVTDDAMPVVKDLTARIHEGTLKYPKNHFLGKMRLVLNLFTHICLSQWKMTYKSMTEQQQNQPTQASSTSGEPPSKKPKIAPFQPEALSAMSNMAVPLPGPSESPSTSHNKPQQPSIFSSGPSSLYASHLATTNTTATFLPPAFPQGANIMNSSSSSSSSPNHHPQPQLRSQSPYQPQSTSFDKPNCQWC